MELIKSINRNLDLENTFSKFKSYHTKPCANFALTYQQKIENKNQITKTILIDGKNVTVYDIDLEFWIIFLMDEIKLVKQVQAYPLWSFGAELGWKQDSSPYAFKLKVHKERDVQYYLKGRLSLLHKEFNIEAATPFEGFESIGNV